MKKTNKQLGFNLIELMIAIAIGSFLIIASTYAFQEARKTYTVNDNVARLYEQGQYVLDTLEEDIRLSAFWGLHNRRSAVRGDTNDALGIAINTISGDCDNNWALNLDAGVSGSNGGSAPTWSASSNCVSDFKANTDTLVLRHADYTEVLTADLEDGQVYVRSDESPQSEIFEGTTQPNVSNEAKNYELRSHGYFISSNSYTNTDNIPMLRRMALVDNGSDPAVETQEVAAGVEDMQIQFGVDHDLRGTAGFGTVDYYVNPDSVVLNQASTRVLAVRLWVLLRSESAENGFTNDKTYNYANVPAYTPNDNFRRLLVTKTVQVRNMDVD